MSHVLSAAGAATRRSEARAKTRSSRLILVTLAAIVVPLGLWGWRAVAERRQTLDVAMAANRAVNDAIAEHTLRLLEGQAFVLDLLDRAAGHRDCPALRADPGLQGTVTDLARRSSQTKTLWIMDARGYVCVSSDPALVDGRDRSFRDYFSRTRELGPGGLFVDRAIVPLGSGEPVFGLARARYDGMDFQGIVLASVGLTDLVRHWQAVASPIPTQRIALFRLDGATIVRSWAPLVPAPDPARERHTAETWNTRPNGTRIGPSSVDGEPRLAAWRTLPGWGVVITTSVATDEVLAPWRRSAALYGIIALLSIALLLALARSLRRSQLRLEHSNAELQDQVAQRTASLRKLNADLEARVDAAVAETAAAQVRAAHAERMQAMGQLAGGIAHDLNNVLQAVQGGTRLIERRTAGLPEVSRLAAMVLDATGRGAAITRRLLSFARRGDLRAEPVEPAGLLDSLHDILSPALGAGIVVRLDHAPDLPPLLADRGQLETVLVNLATNARDAMPEGGELTLSAVLAEAGTTGLPPGPCIRLGVRDTGGGMDGATLERAMEPFFTTKPAGEGTGLGLSMARGFAEQSGGALAIESAVGRGTTVHLWLPLAAGAAASWAAPPAGAASATGFAVPRSGRVLLVDDEAFVRETLAEQLRHAGFAVVVAADAAAALAVLDADPAIEALVSDLTMPGGMDGIGLTRAARIRRSGLPAILLTGYAGDSAGTEFAAAGVLGERFAVLRKPISGEVLAERVGALLAARGPSRS